MKWDKISPVIGLAAGEFAFGIALSLIFLSIDLSDSSFWGNSLASSILSFYAALSAVFFIAVFSVGIFGAITLGKSNRIVRAILYSVLSWLLTMVLYATTFSYFSYTLNLYIILVGIIVGFNLGMKSKAKTENDVS